MTAIDDFLFALTEALPPWLIYLLLAVSSAIENMIPPFPGDTITVFGAYLAGRGFLNPLPVFLWSAAGNLTSNLILYYIGLTKGRDFIRKHPRLFHEDLLARLTLLYRKWGTGMIVFSRFLVAFRSMVPLFAGVSRLRPRRFLFPLVCSIILQQGLIIYLGYTVGQNWNYIKTVLKGVNLGLGLVALAACVLIFFWFRKLRRLRNERALKKRRD